MNTRVGAVSFYHAETTVLYKYLFVYPTYPNKSVSQTAINTYIWTQDCTSMTLFSICTCMEVQKFLWRDTYKC